MTEHYEGFASEGFETFPSLYADTHMISELARPDSNGEYFFTTETIENKLKEYSQFLNRDDLMPRAKATAERISNHLLFELMYREGVFDGE